MWTHQNWIDRYRTETEKMLIHASKFNQAKIGPSLNWDRIIVKIGPKSLLTFGHWTQSKIPIAGPLAPEKIVNFLPEALDTRLISGTPSFNRRPLLRWCRLQEITESVIKAAVFIMLVQSILIRRINIYLQRVTRSMRFEKTGNRNLLKILLRRLSTRCI